MTCRELYYDIHTHKWESCTDEAWLGKEIEDIPLVIVMEREDEYYVWCKKHTMYELIKDNQGIEWHTDSCVMHGFPVCFPHQNNKKSHIIEDYTDYDGLKKETKIPVRWRLTSDEKKSMFYIGVDICELRFYDGLLGAVTRIKKYLYGVSSYNLLNEERKYFQKTIPYPKSVVQHTLDMMADMIKGIYNIKPNIPADKICDEESIIAFMFRPFDMNCIELTRYVPVSKCVPKDCKNAYHIFCEQLGIKPPKGLKKIYYHNPLALPMYRALQELGFRDYNLIRIFFDEAKIGRMDFARCEACDFPFWDDTDYEALEREKQKRDRERADRRSETGMITQEEIDALLCGGEFERIERQREHREWTQLKFMTEWMIKEKGEMVTAWRLHKYTKNGPKGWQQDVSNMIYQYFDNLSEKSKQNFLDKGFSIALHDNLVYEINHFDYVRREINYYGYEEDFECEINGFRFELPRYTDELADIGKEMNNCVASYIPHIDGFRNSLIIVVRKEGHCEACIEVDLRNCCIEQAFGASNEYLTGDVLVAVTIWAEKMLLRDSNHCLNRNELSNIYRERIVCRNIPGRKTYFLYTLKELLSLPAEERENGFYRALTTKFVTFAFNNDIYPQNISIREIPSRDERKYIHTLFPQLDCVIEAAIKEVTEAQSAMFKLYEEFLPRNRVRIQYWACKSEYRDFLKLKRNVYVRDDFL